MTNQKQMEICKKYWSKECTELANKMLILYGLNFCVIFMTDHVSIFEKCLSKDRLVTFKKEYEKAKLENLMHSWKNAMYYYPESSYPGKILCTYARKTCKYCHLYFTPIRVNSLLIRKCRVKKSFEEIDYCEKCLEKAFYPFPKKTFVKNKEKPRGKMIKDLKDLVNAFGLFGFIPSKNYLDNEELLEIIKENSDKMMPILIRMQSPYFYDKEFGSWFKSLIATGILEGDIRETPRGIMCIAKDGHECLSLMERKIDNWLYSNNIPHLKEPKYKLDKKLNPNGLMRADWQVKNVYVEFLGLKGEIEYDRKTDVKRKLCKKLGIKLIEITQKDLKDINKKLNFLIER